ncbi:MAG: hypothetical protein ACE5I1_18150 [bacterium]
MKEIILQHKAEKEKILSQKYVPREKLAFGRKQLDNDLIKVIVGPRRAGKSIFSTIKRKPIVKWISHSAPA